MPRSIKVAPEYIQKVKQALRRHGFPSYNAFAMELGVAKSTVNNYLNGKPVSFLNFVEISQKLGLNWKEVSHIEKEPSQQNQNNSIDLDALVQEVRQKIKPSIKERCGTMRVLDMTHPIGLNDIYTNVNILEKITGRRRKEITELLQESNFDNFERFGLGRITEQRVSGLAAVEKYAKLTILGKPGAGKTTFLKYLAIQCIEGDFHADLVPIFVTLKDFSEATQKQGLLEYISQLFSGSGVTATELANLCNQGRTMILLDGLDEVKEEDSSRVLKEIRDFSDNFSQNRFVITCRIAAREYTFEKFTEVEISDFDQLQIAVFATHWFKGKPGEYNKFIKSIEERIRIKEIATNPLLLTLLCLVFEESGDFPTNRSELYKEGLDTLLKKWDAKRGIYRDQVYKKLSLQRKEDLLSKIALTTFEQCDYFFKQKVVEQYIAEYIRNLPDANTDPEVLQLDAEVVLRSIEAQHGILVERAKGIYSFSHLTFHEYFTAREIVFGTQPLEERLQHLVNHVTEKRWREVFLLAVGMSPSADRLLLLMKQQVDALIDFDEKFQQFLIWVMQKSLKVQVTYKPVAVRAFYFAHALPYAFAPNLVPNLASALDPNLNHVLEELDPAHGFDLILDHAFVLAPTLVVDPTLAHDLGFDFDLDPDLAQALKQLKDKQPDPDGDREKWWKTNGEAWKEQLRAVTIQYRNIGHDWQFSKQQIEVLKQYYDANKLLIDCLNSDCYVSREVRQEIEDTLLLPFTEIEKHRQ
jgi:predicted NACHT family NTPase